MDVKLNAHNKTVEVDLIEWCRRLQCTVDHLHARVCNLEEAAFPEASDVRLVKQATGED